MLSRFQFYVMAIVQTIFVITLVMLPLILYYMNILTNGIAILIVGTILIAIASMIGLPQYNYEMYVEKQKKKSAIKDKNKVSKE